MQEVLRQMNDQYTDKLSESIMLTRQERRQSAHQMPVIRVSTTNPDQDQLKHAFKIIKDQNMRYQEAQKYESGAYKGGHSLKRIGTTHQSRDQFQEIDPQTFIPHKHPHEKSALAQSAIDENKQMQIHLQKQLNQYKTLKEVNDQFFYTPATTNQPLFSMNTRRTNQRVGQGHVPMLLTRSNVTTNQSQREIQSFQKLQSQKSVIAGAVFLPSEFMHSRQLSQPSSSLVRLNTSQQQQTHQDSRISKSSAIRNLSSHQPQNEGSTSLQKLTSLLTMRQEDAPPSIQQQKLLCINDRHKLKYDKDCFLRFYKFKQSLQSQNILFNQLQQQQLLNKGSTSQQIQQQNQTTQVKVENTQDFFVNVKLVVSNELIRYIVLGSSLVKLKAYHEDQCFTFGGKSLDKKRCLTQIHFDPHYSGAGTLSFNTIPQSQNELFNRYGQVAHGFEGKIVIFGGESGTAKNQGQTLYRTLLTDLSFLDPSQPQKHTTVQFDKPIRKVRAFASCILGKYLYYYGGLSDNGAVLNEMIKINLTQNPQKTFKWRKVTCRKQQKGLELPYLAYSKMCPVYYESRLSQTSVERFHLAHLSSEIDWQQTHNYLGLEGLYIFGGFDQNSQATNTLLTVQIDHRKTHTWIEPVLPLKGKSPGARFMHSMEYYSPSNVLIVCGGRNDQSKEAILSDMWVLYIDSLTWTEVTWCSQRLKPRFNFLSMIQYSKLLLLGGQTTNFALAHDYEVVELDQEVNFSSHASKYLLKKMGAFIRANFQQRRLAAAQDGSILAQQNTNSQAELEQKYQGKRPKKNKQDVIKGMIFSAAIKHSQQSTSQLQVLSEPVSPLRRDNLLVNTTQAVSPARQHNASLHITPNPNHLSIMTKRDNNIMNGNSPGLSPGLNGQVKKVVAKVLTLDMSQINQQHQM